MTRKREPLDNPDAPESLQASIEVGDHHQGSGVGVSYASRPHATEPRERAWPRASTVCRQAVYGAVRGRGGAARVGDGREVVVGVVGRCPLPAPSHAPLPSEAQPLPEVPPGVTRTVHQCCVQLEAQPGPARGEQVICRVGAAHALPPVEYCDVSVFPAASCHDQPLPATHFVLSGCPAAAAVEGGMMNTLISSTTSTRLSGASIPDTPSRVTKADHCVILSERFA